MTFLRSFIPKAPPVAPRAAPVLATPATAQAAPTATPQPAHHEHHHGAHGAAHPRRQPKAGWNGPGRPKRPAKPNRTRRRKNAGVPSGDDDDNALHHHEAQSAGTAAVQGREPSRDGGDDQDEGGDERSRQDRQTRARALSGKADEPGGGAKRPKLFDSKVPLQRFVKGSIGVVAQASVQAQLGRAAKANNGALAASALRQLQLGLLGSARPGARLDQGGLARVREHLMANFVKPEKPAGGFAPAVVMLHLTLPMLLLQLQVPRTEEQAALTIAKLMVQARRSQR